MDQAILNRLIAAKNLIESSGPKLTRSSPPILLAQKLLAAHDAAELTFCALAAYPGAAPRGGDGAVLKDPTFMQLARSVTEAAAKAEPASQGSMQRTLEDLVEARKLFKHRGLIVDVRENAHLFDDTVEIIERVTSSLAETSFQQVTKILALDSSIVKSWFESAQEYIVQNGYKRALESTANGLASALYPTDIIVGKPSSEDALLLAGHGVDPSSFLSMQRLLPLTYVSRKEAGWELRRFGHDFNWTRENAEFCLSTAIDVAVKLQSASFSPKAHDFYDFYEDALIVTVDEPEVYTSSSHWFSADMANEVRILTFDRGDVIAGKATGRCDRTSLAESNLFDFAFAEWIAVESPKTERFSTAEKPFARQVLWFRSNEVSVEHRVDEAKLRMRDLLQKNPDEGSNELA